MLDIIFRLALASMGLFILLGPVQAKEKTQHMPTAAELAALPESCQARMGTNQELRNMWNQRMGPDKFMHLHHYCHGLNYLNRARFTLDKRLRREHLQTAIGQFDYVLRNWPPSFSLTIDAQQQKNLAQFMLGKP